MSDNSWVLKGVEPAARERVEKEAARLGVSPADYLTDVVVRQAVLDQLGSGGGEAEATPPDREDAPFFAPQPESPEGFAVRQRLKTLERRLGAAVGSLDGAIHALDTSLFDITARVGDVEALAGDTAHALGQTQQEVGNTVAGLQIHLAVVDDNLAGQAEAQHRACAELDRRIDGVEQVARGAERSAAILSDAHEALKHAVAQDFVDFTQHTADRLNQSLDELRAAADAAAEQADAAVAHLIEELRGLRGSIEQRLEESAGETRARMHAAFADASERMAALSDRVTDNERLLARTAEQLRAQIVEVEDGAQIAVDETVRVLREADAALAADLVRAGAEHYAALQAARSDLAARVEAAHGELAAQLGALREDQLSQLARIKLADVAIGNAMTSLDQVRAAAETRADSVEAAARASVEHACGELAQRLDALAGQTARAEQQAQDLQQNFGAELDRIEATAFAAIEKLRRDVAAGDAHVTLRLEGELETMRSDLAEIGARAQHEAQLLREEQAGALAQLGLLDTALTRLEGASITTNARIEGLETAASETYPELERRLGQLENAAAKAASAQALVIVGDDLARLAERIEALSTDSALADRIAALQQRLDADAAKVEEFGETVQTAARMLNRVAAQGVETAQQAEQRTHALEVSLADLRLELMAKLEHSAASTGAALEERLAAAEQSSADALASLRDRESGADLGRALQNLQERMTAFELRQTNALEALRTEIVGLLDENDRRLAALETAPAAPPNALAAEFESLRSRIEERVLGVELRSVRTLEQVVDTVALLEQRLLSAPDQAAAKSA